MATRYRLVPLTAAEEGRKEADTPTPQTPQPMTDREVEMLIESAFKGKRRGKALRIWNEALKSKLAVSPTGNCMFFDPYMEGRYHSACRLFVCV